MAEDDAGVVPALVVIRTEHSNNFPRKMNKYELVTIEIFQNCLIEFIISKTKTMILA